MKIAIMQPYFFPYIGYFQMLNAVDTFVFLDNVNFIKKGWIHRNKICLNGKDHSFSIPLNKASQNKLISEIALHRSYDSWKEKFKKTLTHAYKKTKNYDEYYPEITRIFDSYSGSIEGQLELILSQENLASTLMEPTFSWPADEHNDLLHLCIDSVNYVARKLGIKTATCFASNYETSDLAGEARILRICQQLKTTHYINAIRGKELYNPENFVKYGIDLRFIKCELEPKEDFNPHRSILDLLFRYPLDEVKEMLYNYRLEK